MPSISQQMMAKPEPKELTTANGKITTSSLSIKKMLSANQSEGQQTSSLDAMPREAFLFDELKLYWKEYAHRLKEIGKETFYNALLKYDPVKQDELHYLLLLDNKIQEDIIRLDIDTLVDFIRKSLNNYGIMIELKINENSTENIQSLSGKDKFLLLARKNASLHILKSTFGLEIEY